jgi:hypothetical protein
MKTSPEKREKNIAKRFSILSKEVKAARGGWLPVGEMKRFLC